MNLRTHQLYFTLSLAAIPSLYDRTITVNGVAKAFAMTGWQVDILGHQMDCKRAIKCKGKLLQEPIV